MRIHPSLACARPPAPDGNGPRAPDAAPLPARTWGSARIPSPRSALRAFPVAPGHRPGCTASGRPWARRFLRSFAMRVPRYSLHWHSSFHARFFFTLLFPALLSFIGLRSLLLSSLFGISALTLVLFLAVSLFHFSVARATSFEVRFSQLHLGDMFQFEAGCTLQIPFRHTPSFARKTRFSSFLADGFEFSKAALATTASRIDSAGPASSGIEIVHLPPKTRLLPHTPLDTIVPEQSAGATSQIESSLREPD